VECESHSPRSARHHHREQPRRRTGLTRCDNAQIGTDHDDENKQAGSNEAEDEKHELIPFAGGPDIALRAAERVWRSLQQPMSHNDGPLSVSGSIGVAIYPDHEREYPALLRRADTAMYIAKRSGSGIQLHQPAQYIPAPRKPAHSPHPEARPIPSADRGSA